MNLPKTMEEVKLISQKTGIDTSTICNQLGLVFQKKIEKISNVNEARIAYFNADIMDKKREGQF